MREAHAMADLVADFLRREKVQDAGADYRITVTDKAGNVGEVWAEAGRWTSEDGFDEDTLRARLKVTDGSPVAKAVQVGDAFVLADVTIRPAWFTGTTWCSGCHDKITSTLGVTTWMIDEQAYSFGGAYRLCGDCADLLKGLELFKRFATCDRRRRDTAAGTPATVRELSGGRVTYRVDGEITNKVVDLVDFPKRALGWLPG